MRLLHRLSILYIDYYGRPRHAHRLHMPPQEGPEGAVLSTKAAGRSDAT